MPDHTLTAEEKRRVSLIRFPLAVGVLLTHTLGLTMAHASYLRGEEGLPGLRASFLNVMIADVFGRQSRPLFFGLAALLLVTGLGPRLEGFGRKLRNRVRTLLVPFLFWNVFAFVFLIACNEILTAMHMSGKGFDVTGGGAGYVVANILGLSGMPFDFPMWFIRNLMLLVLLTPALLWVAKRQPAFFLAAAVALCMCWHETRYASTDSLLYFSVGIVAGLHPAVLGFARRQTLRIVVPYLVMALADGYTSYVGHQIWPLHVATLLLGLPACWALAGLASSSERLSRLLLKLSTYSFLMFALHGMLVHVVVRVFVRLHPTTNVWLLDIMGLFGAVVIVGIVLAVGSATRRYFPAVFAFATGGRLNPPGAEPESAAKQVAPA